MTTVQRTFEVSPTPGTVMEYLKDFGHAEEWDPGTVSCRRTDAGGPVAVGSTWHNTSKIVGVSTELTYTLQSLTEENIVLVGHNDSAATKDTITVRPSGSGSQITYHAEVEMTGTLGKLASPAVKLIFEKLGNATQKQMTTVLNEL